MPAPETHAEGERLQPGIAQRTFELAERRVIYRQALDERGQLADIAARNGQIELACRHLPGSQVNERPGYLLGWTIGAGCVLRAIYCAAMDRGAAAIATFLCVRVGSNIRAIRPPRGG